MRPEQIHKQPPQTKHAASRNTLFSPVLFGRKKVYDMMHSTLENLARRDFHRCVDTAKRGYPLGGTPGERFGTFGAGQRYCPRGMSAVRSTTLCDDNKEK